jgi:dipeptidyl aminopeptidase/acylaminoacyl peptidase
VADNERRGGLSISMRNLFGCESSNLTDSVRAVLKENSPLTYVQPGLPPFLIVQGSADKTVPAGQSLAFQEKLKSAGVNCDLIMIPEGQHRIADWVKFDPAWQGKLISWFNEKLAVK